MANGRPRKPVGDWTQVRIDPEVARMAKLVASEQGVSLADYLTGLIREPVEREFRRIAGEIGDASCGQPCRRGCKNPHPAPEGLDDG